MMSPRSPPVVLARRVSPDKRARSVTSSDAGFVSVSIGPSRIDIKNCLRSVRHASEALG